jgi:KDO2-lipid IV(A) lauroyltransferase
MDKIQKKAEFFAFQFLKALFFLVPRQICLGVGRSLGFLIYFADKKHRHLALSNLNTAFGSSLTPAQKKRIAKASFMHFGKVFADIIKIRHMNTGKIGRLINVEGTEHLQQALLQGKGVLIFSAHLGNWEMATTMVSRIAKIYVIARPLDNRLLEEELGRIRKKLGATVIHKRQAARPVLRALEENAMVAILIDQNVVRDQAVFVDFFGKAAATTPGLAAFFLKTGAPIVPVFCYPAQRGRYSVKIHRPVKITLTGSADNDVLKITQLCTNIIQSQIQENPDFWLWFHNRWKTRPEEEEVRQKETI